MLTSCLKTRDEAGLITDNGSIVVDIPEVSFNNYHSGNQAIAVNATPATEEVSFFTVAAYYPRNKKPSGDIKVKITIAALAGTDPFPAGALTIPTEITLPKDNPRVAVKFGLNKSALDLSKTYGATFTITQVSEGVISELGKSIDVYLNVKNQYDGVYRSKGYFVHPTPANNSSWTFADGITRSLQTIGASTLEVYPLQTKAVTFGVGMDLTVNPDNTVKVDFFGTTDDPEPTPNPNRYDPASKTFYIDASYSGGTRRLVDTLVYLRPR